MRLVRTLDAVILRHVERASHCSERLTGRDCFEQRDAIGVAMVGGFLLSFWGAFSQHLILFAAISAALVVAWIWLLRARLVKDLDRQRRMLVASGFANPAKIDPRLIALRVIALSTTGGVMAMALIKHIPLLDQVIIFVCVTLRSYLDACDPLGPRREPYYIRARLKRAFTRTVHANPARAGNAEFYLHEMQHRDLIDNVPHELDGS